jgi:hypothetical protein
MFWRTSIIIDQMWVPRSSWYTLANLAIKKSDGYLKSLRLLLPNLRLEFSVLYFYYLQSVQRIKYGAELDFRKYSEYCNILYLGKMYKSV